MRPDVLLVSLGGAVGLREADEELMQSLERAGGRRLSWPPPSGRASGGRNPLKRGLDRVLAAWEAARHEGEELAEGIRTALGDPKDGYAERASELLAPWRPEAVDAVVREQRLPRLVSRA